MALRVFGRKHKPDLLALAGLDPAIHGTLWQGSKLPWIPGTRPGMDDKSDRI